MEWINKLHKLDVKYNGTIVNYGNILPLDVSTYKPTVSYNLKPNTYYTLLMIDPDAPSADNPIFSNWLHWLVGNISVSNNNGDTILQYHPPTPPKGSGPHRYILLLFRHNKRNNYINFETRDNFKLKPFILKYNLIKEAGNYYISENKL